MRVLVYEYLTGGGLWSESGDASSVGALLEEGQSMAQAICQDLAAVSDVEVLRLLDTRLKRHLPSVRCVPVSSPAEESAALAKWTQRCDWTLLIGPETDGRLLKRCRQIEAIGGRLLSPDSRFVALTGDKCATAQHLAIGSVPTPYAVSLSGSSALPADFPYPAVIKPCDGAGAVATRRVTSACDRLDGLQDSPVRLEQWIAGTPASVSVISGPLTKSWLPPCRQFISDDGRCGYLGGATPLVSPLAERATRLGMAAMDALPPTTGYIGIDMVLGPDPGGNDDVVLEVNPRLTTSYVGLRQVALANLAEAMLAIADGRDAALRFAERAIQFDVRGNPLLK